MPGPGELPAVVGAAVQSEAEQRWLEEIKAGVALVEEKSIELLLLLVWVEGAKVLLEPGQGDGLTNHLQRLVELFPDKAGAQDGMALKDQLPGTTEGLFVQLSF
jgi:hypothetical protein